MVFENKKPNLRGQLMEQERQFKMKSRLATVVTQALGWLTGDINTVSQHSHRITASYIPIRVLEPPRNLPSLEHKPNLRGPYMETEWQVGMETKPTIVTQVCTRLADMSMGPHPKHFHSIIAPVISSPCARTNQKSAWCICSTQAKSEEPTYNEKMTVC